MTLNDPWGKNYNKFRYGNCLVKWNLNNQCWQVWYRGEVIHYATGTKPCIDYIRERRLKGELTMDAYRHLRRSNSAPENRS